MTNVNNLTLKEQNIGPETKLKVNLTQQVCSLAFNQSGRSQNKRSEGEEHGGQVGGRGWGRERGRGRAEARGEVL